MKPKLILKAVLSIGLLTATATAQMPSGDQIDAAASAKTKVDTPRLAPVRLISNINTTGKTMLVVSRPMKISDGLAEQKAAANLSSALAEATPAKSGTATTSGTFVATSSTGVLAPGQVLSIGSTGGTTTAGATAIGRDVLVVTAPAAAAATTLSANPLAASIERQVFTGDLPRLTTQAPGGLTLPGGGLTAGMITPTTTVAVGPNGFPIFGEATAVPQAGTNPIGPNGFPQPFTTGPQAGTQAIGPNGFPLTTPDAASNRAGGARDASVPVTAGPVIASAPVAGPTAATAVATSATASVGTSPVGAGAASSASVSPP